MQRRGAASARTRSAILDAAHRLLNRPAGSGLTLEEVAAEAGVTRPTVYNQFGSRPALLAAVFEDTGRRIGYQRVRQAQALPDARAALAAALRELGRAWSRYPRAIRRTLALAVLDPEIGALVERYEGYRRAEMAAFAGRLAAERVATARPLRRAADMLGALTGFTVFDALRGRGSVTAATKNLAWLVNAALGINDREEQRHGGRNR